MNLAINNWLIILGFLALVLPAWEMWYRWKPSIWGIFIIGVGIAIVVLSLIKNGQDEDYQTRMELRTNNLQISVDSLLRDQNEDSTRDAVFQDQLLKQFKITRDSLTNRPVQQTFNTHIENARDVKIGSN